MTSHIKRWITGLLALPILVFWLGWGSPLMFAFLIAIVCMLALFEYFRITLDAKNEKNNRLHLEILGYTSGLSIILASYLSASTLVVVVLSVNLLLAGFFLLYSFKTDPSIVMPVAMQVQGVIYIPVLISFLVLIRNGEDGILWIFFLLAVVFAGDIGAYYVGSYLGGRKLCPSVSPKKTWEGSVGGITANILIGGIIKSFFMPSLSWAICIVMCVSIGLSGQIGDLFESALKRAAQVKDSGVILPGHGGMLDRIDALLFTAPVAFIFKEYFIY